MAMAMMTDQQAKDALLVAARILKADLVDFTHAFRASTSVNNIYPKSENVEWTTGFCTGTYWLAYQATKDEAFRDAALVHVDSFLERIEKRVDVDHHDMGFLYSLSCVAAYKLTGSQNARKAALMAADNLMARFHEKGQFFQAWGEIGAPENYRMIIDCLLNLPLLYWAADQTGDQTYTQKAVAHVRSSAAHLVRPGGSAYHTYFFDPQTGAPLRGVTAQGYKDDSSWARGQAWAIYGFALSYRYTRDPELLPLFDQVTRYYLDRLPSDLVPYWDLDFTQEDGEPRDSSAAVIACCGLLEMMPFLPPEQAQQYEGIVRHTAAELWANYAVREEEQCNGLLKHGVYAKSSPYNTVTDRGVDECNTWGDYFWMELLIRLTMDWDTYW